MHGGLLQRIKRGTALCRDAQPAEDQSGDQRPILRVGLNPEVEHIAREINHRLSFTGAWFFQLRQDSKGRWKLLEIAPRIAGTSGLTRNRGLNLPLLTVYQMMGIPVELLPPQEVKEVDRALISRYRTTIDYDTVYVDLDDTLLLDSNRVNAILMMFLYQAVNQRKQLILLTRHERSPEDTLKRHRISPGLFDRILHIQDGRKKSDYITEPAAILIDDSFRERKNVQTSAGIPVFDVDAVESLLNWQE